MLIISTLQTNRLIENQCELTNVKLVNVSTFNVQIFHTEIMNSKKSIVSPPVVSKYSKHFSTYLDLSKLNQVKNSNIVICPVLLLLIRQNKVQKSSTMSEDL